ncbi:hypothetical protein H6CHR_03213 [Variovorax sp. PBL-H6]|uniref:hypothetical protein n=1 Tax=Variovorax sp. PBL-H6 TaxID=434009 RepID=UPI0013180FAB|nr:hypothetical protein [Variovorax sp. PBL-H6]VTU29528.1 hypothetical protein H6CHR_03213 [Variovorax sp. PBL-H6]
MTKQIIALARNSATTKSTTSDNRQDVDHYRSISPSARASLAHEMATEVGQHYDRARSLVMVLTERLRAESEGYSVSLDLAEIAEAWLHNEDHIAQEERLMACLRASVEAANA